MKHSARRLMKWGLALSALATLASGCALFAPVLIVEPGAIDFGVSQERTLRISKTGSAPLDWTLTEVTRASVDDPWVDADVPWLNPETTSGRLTAGIDNVKLLANVSGLPVGQTASAGVRIDSNGGSKVIPVSITVAQTLFANPDVVSLEPAATSATFTVSNTGAATVAWNVQFLDDPSDLTTARPLPQDILVQPNPGSTGPGGSTTATVQFTAGRDDFALLVSSSAGSAVVRFVFGSLLTDLTTAPQTVRLFYTKPEAGSTAIGTQAETTLTISNSGGATRNWTIEARNKLNPANTPPISLAPVQGATTPSSSSEVIVTLSPTANPDTVLLGNGNYELVLRSGDGFIIVPVIVELLSLPEIAASEPPSASAGRPEIVPVTTLDFGRTEVQKEFWIANTGPRDSRLYFRITHEDQGVEDPVIASVDPLTGNTTGSDEIFFHPPGANTLVDAERILVTIDRTNMTEDVEFRTITIVATDEDGANVLDPVEPVEVVVRAERSPLTVEGAINRSRPPFLLRFAFLLRDSLGRVIPTQSQDDLDRLTFGISEEEQVLDLNETNFFLQGPENLKTNVVLMLDYTGSMYNAGTTNQTDPLLPGEAVLQVREAAKDFINDLPPTYRIQLMYYNDRQQRDRVLLPFTTDKAALVAALDAFSLPPSLFGTSTIRDALADAIERLANEDAAETLPFDEADVRAVVFITDGNDNGSVTNEADVVNFARENRVRLYPLVYAAGGPVNQSETLVFANDTGGHSYAAPTVGDLTRFLSNRQGIGVEPADFSEPNNAKFFVTNAGSAFINWTVDIESAATWIKRVSPNASGTGPGGRSTVNITFDGAGLPADEPVVGRLFLTAAAGGGTATITIVATPTLVGGVPTFTRDNIELTFEDPSGEVWNELQNQIVLTYVTPLQDAGSYNIQINYQVDEDTTITGAFEEDAVFAPGDVRAGQIALTTSGLVEDPGAVAAADRVRADVYVRSDYIPRDTTSFRMRFVTSLPDDIAVSPLGLAAQAALDQATMDVTLASDGLLVPTSEFDAGWRLLSEGDGIYRMRTEGSNDLLYGAFGNLLRIRFANLAAFAAVFDGSTREPEFLVGMRVDNDAYYSPAGGGQPSRSKFFFYPGGPAYLDAGPDAVNSELSVTTMSAIAGPAPTVAPLLATLLFDPEVEFPWDLDGDDIVDFQDPSPFDDAIPGGVVVPGSFEIGESVNAFQLRVRNNRLDTFVWSVASLPAWVTVTNIVNGPGALAPGDESVISLSVDRTGFSDTVVSGSLVIDTDEFGSETIPLTMVVAPQP
ncbi:MAG: VWA domain-containing protein [Candidatus Hydrogenedens sp.]|nr:VWA domain-containing protein [Candidatus Hydrogenedens sp.]